jgi:hypothetical protein
MQNKLPKNTIIGSTYLFLFGCFLFIKTDAAEFPDSVRYFLGNSNSLWQEIIAHTGRNIQTIIFSVGYEVTGNKNTGALIANLGIWFLAGTLLLFFLDKNIKNLISKFLFMLTSILIFTAYIVASWISCVLSESIALSFLIPLLIISLVTILDQVEISTSKNWITTFNILLFFAQPLWGALLLPLAFFVLFNGKKYVKQVVLIGLAGIFSMFIATASHSLPYENTGLTYKGFESLTRAYFFSLDGRFGEVALGDNIKNCKPAYDLLRFSQTKGSPNPLFISFKDASMDCPELVNELNAGKSNSIPRLLTNDLKDTLVMTTVGLYAIGNQRPLSGDTLSNRTIGGISSDLLIPFGIFLAPGSILLLRNKKQVIYISGSLVAVLLGGLLLYFQVGIEGERHSLPTAIILGITPWIIFIDRFSAGNKV